MAFEEYSDYVRQQKLTDFGFAEEPSVAWLTIAIIAAGVDAAAAVKTESKARRRSATRASIRHS